MLLRFFGPADLGRREEPPAPRDDAPCERCGRPFAAHRVLTTPAGMQVRCPPQAHGQTGTRA